MRFTLITVCFNAGEELAETIESVRAQTHPDIEHIVVDGAGPDEATQAVLARYRSSLSAVISEPDQGIYDAMNKGLALATGDVVGFVNAGDMLVAPTVIASLDGEFRKDDIDAIYGDALMVDPQDINRVKRYWRGGAYDRELFRAGWMPPHLGTYIQRRIYLEHGGFDLRLAVAADYELLFRFFYKHRISARYVPLTIIRFRLGGTSNRTLSHIWKANREVVGAWRLNGELPPAFLSLRKPLRKLKQLFGGGS